MPAVLALPAFWGAVSAGAAGGAVAYGAHKQSQATDAATAASSTANAAALAEQKRQDDLQKSEFDQQQAALKTQWDAQQTNLAPYRAASGAALSKLGDLFGLNLGSGGGAAGPSSGPSGAPPTTTGQPSASGPAPAVNWTADPQTLTKQLNDYFTSKGVATTETPFWVQHAAELVQRGQQLNDPTYADKRLAAADIFGGGGGSTSSTTASPLVSHPDLSPALGPQNGLAASYSPVIPMSQLMRPTA